MELDARAAGCCCWACDVPTLTQHQSLARVDHARAGVMLGPVTFPKDLRWTTTTTTTGHLKRSYLGVGDQWSIKPLISVTEFVHAPHASICSFTLVPERPDQSCALAAGAGVQQAGCC